MKYFNFKKINSGFTHTPTLKKAKLVCGFTLVEMMVAIAVFSVVMVTAMSALLNIIDANNKARAIKIAVDNVSFALEGISKDMRMGTEYACAMQSDGVDPVGSCRNGGDIIKYRSPRAPFEADGVTRKFAYYKYDSVNKNIQECLSTISTDCTFSGPFTPITSSEVKIMNMKFYVLNDDLTTPLIEQPRMIITLTGEAGWAKDKIKTDFDLQTSVSQRVRPVTI